MAKTVKKTDSGTRSDNPLSLQVHKLDGSPTSETVALDPRLFGLPRNDHVIYLSVKAELANRRQGTHSTLPRSGVRGGGKKPWRQKGRGAARAGTIRSPIWRGGGKIFGPEPHPYIVLVPAKVRRLARKTALSLKAQGGAIRLVEDFDLDKPRTRTMASLLKTLEIDGKSALLMLEGNKPAVVKSCRNIQRFKVREGMNASTYDIMRARNLIISRSALDALQKGLIDEK